MTTVRRTNLDGSVMGIGVKDVGSGLTTYTVTSSDFNNCNLLVLQVRIAYPSMTITLPTFVDWAMKMIDIIFVQSGQADSGSPYGAGGTWAIYDNGAGSSFVSGSGAGTTSDRWRGVCDGTQRVTLSGYGDPIA